MEFFVVSLIKVLEFKSILVGSFAIISILINKIMVNKKKSTPRYTTLVRLDSILKEAVQSESGRTGEPMSKIMDFAVEEYLKSVKSLD